MSGKKPPVKALDWLERRIIRRIGGILLNADSWKTGMREYSAYMWVDGQLRQIPQRWTRFSASTVTEDGYKIRVRIMLDTRVDSSSLRIYTKVQKEGQSWYHGGYIRWHHFFGFKSGEPVPFDKLKTEWAPKIESMMIGSGISLMRRPHGGTTSDQPEDQSDGTCQDGGSGTD